MKILITGITGFAGSHLADFILANFPDIEIFGIKRWRSKTENIEHLKEKLDYFISEYNICGRMLTNLEKSLSRNKKK